MQTDRIIMPGSPEWFVCRCGSWSASRAPALMARTKKGEPTAAYNDLIGEVAAERLTGQTATHYVTAAMQRGLDLEPEAADAYALERMVALGESRLVLHPTLERVCATPDRFVGTDGLLEIKCPSVQTKHLGTLLRNERSVEHEYAWQVHFQLWCTGRQWADLMSYDPRFPPAQQIAVVRIERDEAKLAELAAAVERAERDVAEILSALESLTTGQRAEAEMEAAR